VGNINEAFSDVLVIDDICDGGRTFTSLVEHLPNVRRHLYVTHGVFSKGVEILYSSGYESVAVVNDFKNRIFGLLNFRVR
jgi:ribose-phosphate pyrophosphokinase